LLKSADSIYKGTTLIFSPAAKPSRYNHSLGDLGTTHLFRYGGVKNSPIPQGFFLMPP